MWTGVIRNMKGILCVCIKIHFIDMKVKLALKFVSCSSTLCRVIHMKQSSTYNSAALTKTSYSKRGSIFFIFYKSEVSLIQVGFITARDIISIDVAALYRPNRNVY